MKKKVIAGALALAVLLGGVYYYADSGDLQGRFGSKITNSSKTVKIGSSSSSSSSSSSESSTEVNFSVDSVSYDESLNYFQASICSYLFGTSASPTLAFTVTSTGETKSQTVTLTEGCKDYGFGDLNRSYDIQEAGTYFIRAVLDEDSQYTEISETDNDAGGYVTIEPNAYVFGDNVDVSLASIELPQGQNTFMPEICIDGDFAIAWGLKLNYTIKGSNGATISDIDYTINAGDVSDLLGTCGEVDIIDPNIGVFGDDNYTVTVELDPEDEVSETNESNNSATEVSVAW